MMTRNNLFFAVIILSAMVLIFIAGRSCGIKSVLKQAHNDTVITKDSIVKVYVPQPYAVAHDSIIDHVKLVPVFKPIPVHDTVIAETDTAAILKDYFAKYAYSDTQQFRRGTVIINDTISRNRIAGRSFKAVWIDSIITRQITLQPPKRYVAYFTCSAMGNKTNPFCGIGIGAAVKFPNDLIINGEWKMITGFSQMAEARVMLPLRFKK